jgi:hypothetical protein
MDHGPSPQRPAHAVYGLHKIGVVGFMIMGQDSILAKGYVPFNRDHK